MNIVVLDDSFTVRLTVEALLEDLGVAEDDIHSFESASLALEHIKENPPHLILSDLYMPEMNGDTFAKMVFEINQKYRAIFFLMSGEEDYTEYTKLKKIGITKFIKKPLEAKRFKHFIHHVIRRYEVNGAYHSKK